MLSTFIRTTAKGSTVEIKIGVQDTPREISLETDASVEDIAAAVESAVANGTMLRLLDDRGRTVFVPGAKITYVELGAPSKGRVGFGSAS